MPPPARLTNRLDGGNDLVIPGATAQIPGDGLLNFPRGRRRVAIQQGLGREDHARRTVAALNGPVIDEGLLHGVKPVAGGQTFDGGDRLALGFHRQIEAGPHGNPLQQDRAGPAGPVVTTFLGAGQAQVLPQGFEEGAIGRNGDFVLVAVDL